MGGTFLAVDWGTSNRRAYLIADGTVIGETRDTLGILSVPAGGFPAATRDLRVTFGSVPVLLAGMVGSNRGWIDAGYVPAPATLEDIARRVVPAAEGVGIVPGVSIVDGTRGDVMRGEEVQLLGAVVAGLAPADGLLCQPGTHCKWARIADGALVDFATAMTGELFALLRDHALIGAAMKGEVAAGAAFADGVDRSARDDLAAALFGVRPASLLGLRDDADAAAYVSGLLIGADCRSQANRDEPVHLLADPFLGGLYATALAQLGVAAVPVDSRAAFIAGAIRIQELLA